MSLTSIHTTEGIAVALGVTTFLVLIGAEYFVASARGQSVHRFNDSVGNLACGVIHQVANVHYSSFLFPAYELLRHRFRIAGVEQFSFLGGVALLLLVDFIYYWEHRLLHASPVLWKAHVVHHQSEEFNLTVSLRVSILQVWATTASTLVLAVIGFPPGMALTALLAYKFYQFWTHTQMIGRLGPLEWLFVTPSHHRVHHAQNERYLNKNFGGMLIIWDRLFGTFEPECEPPRYGVLDEALSTYNPVLTNVQPWLALRRAAASAVSRSAAPAPAVLHRVSSVVLRLAAVVGLAMALVLAEATSGVGTWTLVTLVSFVWLWQLGSALDGRRIARGSDALSVLLALGANAALMANGAAVPAVTCALVIGAALTLLASTIGGRRVA